MKIEQIIYSESNSILNNLSIVYFKDFDRAPILGYFVKLEDAEELSSKKMVRFVSRAKDELFENKNSYNYTKIIALETLKNQVVK